MPETLDDLFAAVSADVAARTSAPGAREAIASTRRRTATVAVASAVVVLVAALTTGLLGGAFSSDRPDPATSTPPPEQRLGIGRNAVWYDDAGLHHGSDVLRPAVRLRTSGGPSGLARVRTGALYIDAVGEDVWFHPWKGEPRVVGHDSRYGAVGDPEGDTAAWFEGDRNAWADAELVVYDTVRLREIARVRTAPVGETGVREHVRHDHGIMQVSTGAVVWQTEDGRVLELDVESGEVTRHASGTGRSRTDPSLVDVHGETELLSWSDIKPEPVEGLVLRSPGGGLRQLAGFEPRGRLSPDGRFLLAVTSDPHGAAFVDVATGESSRVPVEAGEFYAWLGWSNGSTALIHVTREGDKDVSELYACDAERPECELLPSVGFEPIVPPT